MKTILGTMIFSGKTALKEISIPARITNADEVKKILDYFKSRGYSILDTARIYCGGDTEEVLGEIGTDGYEIHTKAHPVVNGNKGLTPENITTQLNNSLEALKMKSVDIFYLHMPDHDHSLKDALKSVNELYKQGKFKEFGLSNYSAWQVTQIYTICDYEGWVKPTVYQGMYNAITRDIEKELLPCLKKFGIKFYAYNPLAGGMLARRYAFEDVPDDGRFSNQSVWGQRYRERYWKKEAFRGLESIADVCEKNGITMADAAIRWIYNHSKLSNEHGDAIIIGASSIGQLEKNLNSAENKTPLPQEVLDAFDSSWVTFAPVCPTYFR